MSEPVLIWGAGAIGGSIGAALVRAGHEVLFVDRAADHVAAINRAGLEITGPIDSYTVRARAITPERVERSVRDRPARRQGAGHRGRGARARAASGAGRLSWSRPRTG